MKRGIGIGPMVIGVLLVVIGSIRQTRQLERVARARKQAGKNRLAAVEGRYVACTPPFQYGDRPGNAAGDSVLMTEGAPSAPVGQSKSTQVLTKAVMEKMAMGRAG